MSRKEIVMPKEFNFGQIATTEGVIGQPEQGVLQAVANLAGRVATAMFSQFSTKTLEAVAFAGSDRRGHQPNPTTIELGQWVNTNHRT